ncbi:hypothetical protein HK100_004271 [Physocladia obscura]|uniref:Uncharacterized protein n=1 Tax=Physocladia obscura TaxID=109957 RepID=A0AAD5T839_9FUNG|nr:hypothetical protein HK100_004271 [Physocladia obscura]
MTEKSAVSNNVYTDQTVEQSDPALGPQQVPIPESQTAKSIFQRMYPLPFTFYGKQTQSDNNNNSTSNIVNGKNIDCGTAEEISATAQILSRNSETGSKGRHNFNVNYDNEEDDGNSLREQQDAVDFSFTHSAVSVGLGHQDYVGSFASIGGNESFELSPNGLLLKQIVDSSSISSKLEKVSLSFLQAKTWQSNQEACYTSQLRSKPSISTSLNPDVDFSTSDVDIRPFVSSLVASSSDFQIASSSEVEYENGQSPPSSNAGTAGFDIQNAADDLPLTKSQKRTSRIIQFFRREVTDTDAAVTTLVTDVNNLPEYEAAKNSWNVSDSPAIQKVVKKRVSVIDRLRQRHTLTEARLADTVAKENNRNVVINAMPFVEYSPKNNDAFKKASKRRSFYDIVNSNAATARLQKRKSTQIIETVVNEAPESSVGEKGNKVVLLKRKASKFLFQKMTGKQEEQDELNGTGSQEYYPPFAAVSKRKSIIDRLFIRSSNNGFGEKVTEPINSESLNMVTGIQTTQVIDSENNGPIYETEENSNDDEDNTDDAEKNIVETKVFESETIEAPAEHQNKQQEKQEEEEETQINIDFKSMTVSEEGKIVSAGTLSVQQVPSVDVPEIGGRAKVANTVSSESNAKEEYYKTIHQKYVVQQGPGKRGSMALEMSMDWMC